ncbi:unnamed protein product [Lepeophtheirus salmonis]|uniref:(salmon louse) hypothetical protein n=1 Tax=Lepeophtheirus salmonis TaxID=72036 RepID=A0A7R8CTC0_LEPSM|nr:unnamed protein product [Lepeophtheirus salmonis]CAF2922101.1 unnamed protein product [Lepeophtheirus salmonis]
MHFISFFHTSLSSSCIDASKWINALGGYRVEVSNQNFDSSIITFTCAEGYYLIGSSKLNCYRGILNGSFPICSMDIGINGIPSQSSGNSPYYAINSDLMTCSQTLETDASPWWMLDLLQVVEISAIRIVLTHHNFDRIMVESMEVRIGNSSNYQDNPICAFLIQDDKEVNENDTIVIPCAGARGRYISLNSVNTEPRFLILCKVLILVDPSKYIHPRQCLSPNEGYLHHQRLTRFKVINGRCVIWRRGKESSFLEARNFCENRGLRLPLTSVDLNYHNVRSSILVRWLSHHFEYKSSPRSYTWVSISGTREKFEDDVNSSTTTKTTELNEEVMLDCWALDTANAWKWNLRPCESKAHVVCVSDPKTCVNPEVNFGTRIKKPHSFWIEK